MAERINTANCTFFFDVKGRAMEILFAAKDGGVGRIGQRPYAIKDSYLISEGKGGRRWPMSEETKALVMGDFQTIRHMIPDLRQLVYAEANCKHFIDMEKGRTYQELQAEFPDGNPLTGVGKALERALWPYNLTPHTCRHLLPDNPDYMPCSGAFRVPHQPGRHMQTWITFQPYTFSPFGTHGLFYLLEKIQDGPK